MRGTAIQDQTKAASAKNAAAAPRNGAELQRSAEEGARPRR